MSLRSLPARLLSLLLFSCLPCVGLAAGTGLHGGDVEVGQGVRIHYLEGGARDAATTWLFVPGWSATTAIWRDQMTAFATDARVVAIDPRSQGQSTVTPYGNTPEQRARDLEQVIRALDLRHVILVGWSQGVQDVAAYAAAAGGDRIAGYVLVDAAVGAGAADSVSHPEQLTGFLDRLSLYQRNQRAYLHGMFEAIISAPAARTRIDAYVDAGMRTPPDLGISMLLMDFVAYDRRAALDRFDRPTLIVASARSTELQAQRAMAERIRGARLEVVADAAHAVFLDQPKRFQELLAGFAAGLASPAAR